jgi:hypothetical protein
MHMMTRLGSFVRHRTAFPGRQGRRSRVQLAAGVAVVVVLAVAVSANVVSGLAPHHGSVKIQPVDAEFGLSGDDLCARTAVDAGFSSTDRIDTPIGYKPIVLVAVAIALNESQCDPNATHYNKFDDTWDRGLWQINVTYWAFSVDVRSTHGAMPARHIPSRTLAPIGAIGDLDARSKLCR